jgi:hypothetical protein
MYSVRARMAWPIVQEFLMPEKVRLPGSSRNSELLAVLEYDCVRSDRRNTGRAMRASGTVAVEKVGGSL